jgi:hypothetical protein
LTAWCPFRQSFGTNKEPTPGYVLHNYLVMPRLLPDLVAIRQVMMSRCREVLTRQNSKSTLKSSPCFLGHGSQKPYR